MTTIRNLAAIFRKELGSYFLSPMAYMVIFLFMVTNGFVFWLYSTAPGLTGQPHQIPTIVEDLFGFAIFWILPLSPLLTMRLFAEERRTGTLEVLMTAPVTAFEVVAGKFLAAQVFYCLIWLSLLPLFVILDILGNPDWGPIGSMFLGIYALGLLTNSLGLLASAATRNQLVSAILALSGNLFFFLMSLGRLLFPEDFDVRRVFHYLSFTSHFGGEYSRGIVDLRYLVFYGSFAAFFMLLTVRLVEARKWR